MKLTKEEKKAIRQGSIFQIFDLLGGNQKLKVSNSAVMFPGRLSLSDALGGWASWETEPESLKQRVNRVIRSFMGNLHGLPELT